MVDLIVNCILMAYGYLISI